MTKFNKTNSLISIIILGSGFAAIEVLKKLQKHYKNNDNIEITILGKDNFLLFTPMLPQVFSGIIEPRHIVTPVRSFCNKRTKFCHGYVQDINFKKKSVTISYSVGSYLQPSYYKKMEFKFDYLVIALGNQTNFFGNKDIEKYTFTMKSINDAFVLRNHIINILEQASIDSNYNADFRKSLLTFVVVGGGFSGIETVGELNYFVKDAVRSYYKNIDPRDIKIMLVDALDSILTEVDDDLGKYAKKILEKKGGVEFKLNRMAKGATQDKLILDSEETVFTHTIVWTAGVSPDELVKGLDCKHDNNGYVKTDETLEVENYPNVYAVGDCASTTNPFDGNPYPPTAQHAIKQGQLAAKNIINGIEGKPPEKIKYRVRGTMATIGNRAGVAKIFGFKFKGLIAWLLWRSFYLSHLPLLKKRLRIMGDWAIELIFHNDVSMIKGYNEEKHVKNKIKSINTDNETEFEHRS